MEVGLLCRRNLCSLISVSPDFIISLSVFIYTFTNTIFIFYNVPLFSFHQPCNDNQHKECFE